MGGAQRGAGCFENEWRHQHRDAIWGIGQLYYFYIYICFVFFLTCPLVTCSIIYYFIKTAMLDLLVL